MTQGQTPRRTLTAPQPSDRPKRVSRRSVRWILGDDFVSVSLVLVVLASAATLPRLFADHRLQQPILLVACATSLMAAIGRFLRLPFFFATAISGIFSAVYTARFLFPALVVSIAPHRLPFRQLIDAVRLDWSQLSVTKTPVVDRPGFALSAIAGVWIVSVLADVLAFTLRSPTEALVPPAVLVLVGAIVAPSGNRVWPATLFCSAAVLHIGAVTLATSRRRTWTDGRAPHVAPQLARIALAVGAAALATAVFIPRTGIVTGEGFFDWRTGTVGRLPSKVTSPMVSLKRQLLNLPNTVMFTASSTNPGTGSPERSYWRLSTLTEFNGATWTSSASYRDIDRSSNLAVPAIGASAPDVVQSVVIEELASSWLPMGYQAQSLDTRTADDNVSLGYDRQGSAVLLSKPTHQGDSYVVRSVRATVDAGTAGRLIDVGWSASDVALPKNFSPPVKALAQAIVANADSSRITSLQALQQFFRTQFTYSTDVPPPSKQDDLERFVLTDRAGYCEQFAGSFAAMARSLGIPARVAVGFSPGRLGTDGRFTVTGKNSHAWPEAYIDGVGWLPFEPTPGRGIPGAEDYTGVADQDASEGITPETPAATPTTVAPAAAATLPAGPTTVAPPPLARPQSTSRWVAVGTASTAVVVSLAGLWLLRRTRRRNAVEARWKRIRRRLERRGIKAEATETDAAFAQRAAALLSGSSALLLPDLAGRVEAHRYGPADEWTDSDTVAFLVLAEQLKLEPKTRSKRTVT